jgi:hypothetical protein
MPERSRKGLSRERWVKDTGTSSGGPRGRAIVAARFGTVPCWPSGSSGEANTVVTVHMLVMPPAGSADGTTRRHRYADTTYGPGDGTVGGQDLLQGPYTFRWPPGPPCRAGGDAGAGDAGAGDAGVATEGPQAGRRADGDTCGAGPTMVWHGCGRGAQRYAFVLRWAAR